MSNQKKTVRVLLFVVLALYSALVVFGVYHHEPWRDEAHPWLSAKEDSIIQIIESVRYAPTPILWTVLLMPLAKLGFPYISMNIVHAIIAAVTIGLLLFLSKIPLILKILIPFTYYMAYEYAVIARNYILTGLLLFCIASVYNKRLEKPLVYALFLSLLFQTNLYSALPAGLLALAFFGEVSKQTKITFQKMSAVILMTASALFTFITYLPAKGPFTSGPENIVFEMLNILMNAVTTTLFSKLIGVNSYILFMTIMAVTLLVFILFFLTIIRKRALFVIVVSSFLWFLVMNMFFKSGTLRHHGLFFVYLIFFIWIAPRYSRSDGSVYIIQRLFYSLLGILLIFSIVSTIYIYQMDYRFNFSGAEDMANYLKRNNLLEKNITVYRAGDVEALLPYIDNKKFWYPEVQEFTRYHINDSRAFVLPYISMDDIRDSSYKHFHGDAAVLYLLSSPIEELWRPDYKLLHTSQIVRFWGNDTEQFWLYSRVQRK